MAIRVCVSSFRRSSPLKLMVRLPCTDGACGFGGWELQALGALATITRGNPAVQAGTTFGHFPSRFARFCMAPAAATLSVSRPFLYI
jgi:hypothetical protein